MSVPVCTLELCFREIHFNNILPSAPVVYSVFRFLYQNFVCIFLRINSCYMPRPCTMYGNHQLMTGCMSSGFYFCCQAAQWTHPATWREYAGLSFLKVKRPNTVDLGLQSSNEVLPSPSVTHTSSQRRGQARHLYLLLLTKLHDVPNLDVVMQVQRSEGLTAVPTKIPVFCDVTLYTLVYWYRRFGSVCCYHRHSGPRRVTLLSANIHGATCQIPRIFSCAGASHCKIDHCTTEVGVWNCFLLVTTGWMRPHQLQVYVWFSASLRIICSSGGQEIEVRYVC